MITTINEFKNSLNEEYITVETKITKALEETGLYSHIHIDDIQVNQYFAIQLKKKGKKDTYYIEQLEYDVINNNTLEDVINMINDQVDQFYDHTEVK